VPSVAARSSGGLSSSRRAEMKDGGVSGSWLRQQRSSQCLRTLTRGCNPQRYPRSCSRLTGGLDGGIMTKRHAQRASRERGSVGGAVAYRVSRSKTTASAKESGYCHWIRHKEDTEMKHASLITPSRHAFARYPRRWASAPPCGTAHVIAVPVPWLNDPHRRSSQHERRALGKERHGCTLAFMDNTVVCRLSQY
jgi:hypothetical protein